MYVDANATYPVAPKHYDDVANLLKRVDGNPSSIHARGREAKVALEAARTHVAKLFGARGPEVVFTSGATEANNLAIQGVVGRVARESGDPQILPHVVISGVEHSSVLEPAKILAARHACRLDIARVGADGVVDAEHLLQLIESDTALVCVMHANNEVGAVNPVRELATAIKAKAPAAHVHVDAVQMFGKSDLTWYAGSAVNSASVSAHKIGGFKGVGALFLQPGSKLQALIAGGGQERGRRPGTENMPGILSFGKRCEELQGQALQWTERMRQKRDVWLTALHSVPGVVIHGKPEQGLPNTVNFHVDGVTGDDILLNFDLAGFQASSGSACSSGSARPSHVLMAMGYDEWVALNSVRISFAAEGDDDAEIARMLEVLRGVLARTSAAGKQRR